MFLVGIRDDHDDDHPNVKQPTEADTRKPTEF